jgi:hypothetical protein
VGAGGRGERLGSWDPASIRAVSHPSGGPAGYSGTPLARKLGIKPEHRVVLVAAPAGFDLGPLPPGVRVSRVGPHGAPPATGADVTVVFCQDRATLARWFGSLKANLPPAASLWVAWPKKAAKIPTDLDEALVREHGLAGGLVDVKICAVDQTWSGLKFLYRLGERPNASRTQA